MRKSHEWVISHVCERIIHRDSRSARHRSSHREVRIQSSSSLHVDDAFSRSEWASRERTKVDFAFDVVLHFLDLNCSIISLSTSLLYSLKQIVDALISEFVFLTRFGALSELHHCSKSRNRWVLKRKEEDDLILTTTLSQWVYATKSTASTNWLERRAKQIQLIDQLRYVLDSRFHEFCLLSRLRLFMISRMTKFLRSQHQCQFDLTRSERMKTLLKKHSLNVFEWVRFLLSFLSQDK